mgnify:CR=1 FL=1
MYSPFRNEQGQPKELDEVTYADLAQLKELEEGFALEFKRTWNENVRVKVPKIIASFANSHGGWLIIGIADDDKAVCPIPKRPADFSQIFGELCRHHVFPTPRFDTRFIADPANPAQGVVVVQVYEGDFPPYVADGIVEIREGSTSGPALGSALVELYGDQARAGDPRVLPAHRMVPRRLALQLTRWLGLRSAAAAIQPVLVPNGAPRR